MTFDDKLNNYLSKISQHCCVCGDRAEIHHPRFCVGMGQRASDWLAIPLCPRHHRTGGKGVAIHAGIRAFEDAVGKTEVELLANTIERWHKFGR